MKILIVGATSAIAIATARRFAIRNPHFCLLARNISKMESVSKDLIIRGAASAKCLSIDLVDQDQQLSLIHI